MIFTVVLIHTHGARYYFELRFQDIPALSRTSFKKF